MGVGRREVYKSVYSKAALVPALGEEKAPRSSMQEEQGFNGVSRERSEELREKAALNWTLEDG